MITFIVFVVFLLLSAFFSSAETAFTAINQLKLRNLIEDKNKNTKYLEKVLYNPKRLLTAILIGNNLANIGASAVATAFLLDFLSQFIFLSHGMSMVIITISMTTLLLIFGEITPKTFAIKNPDHLAFFLAKPIYVFLVMFHPIITLFNSVSIGVSMLFGISPKKVSALLTNEEIQTILKIAKEEGLLEEEEREMIDSIFELGETIVREIMTPRTDTIFVDVKSSITDAIQIITEKGHSRLPVYEGNLDNILGILYAKDLLNISGSTDQAVRNFVREAVFVPETKPVEELLQQMKKSKFHMAVILDEHGGVSGIVTLEDIIEEIIGEIQDEYDKDDQPLYIKLSDNHFIFDAKINMDDVAELLDTPIPEETDYDTLGGFVLSEMGKFPRKGEEIALNGMKFKVVEISKRRILKIEVRVEKAVTAANS